MKALVVGSGGREHAIVWKLSQSRFIDKIYCTAGNAGISELAECVDVDSSDFGAILDFVRYNWIDFTIVGPEGPLSRGIVDVFERDGKKIVGPCKAAAQIESSKIFAKEFMKKYRIPTAEYKAFTSHIYAEEYVKMKGAPVVIKADGLAAGKGVFVVETIDEAIEAIRLIMKDKAFGDAGSKIIIEDFLEGEEASFMVFTDGSTIVPMVSSQDHKRVFDGDKGPNTGGMGAYSPAPVITKELEAVVMEKIMMPVINGMKAEGIKYKGILYAGLMIKDGIPNVLEFNCRLGDPETQPVLSRLDTDLVDIAIAIADEKLSEVDIQWKDDASVCVILASGGYPGAYEKGKIINGLDFVKTLEGVTVFHAGTVFDNSSFITNGGRVLGVTAMGKDIIAAKARAYDAVARISFEGMHYRKDIADRAINRK